MNQVLINKSCTKCLISNSLGRTEDHTAYEGYSDTCSDGELLARFVNHVYSGDDNDEKFCDIYDEKNDCLFLVLFWD